MIELHQQGGETKRILLAEDDEDDIMMFKEAISDVPFPPEIILAKDGDEVIDILQSDEKAPDIIFMDINMPRKNGFETLTEIRELFDAIEVPVIFISTHQSEEMISRAKKLGAIGYIKKPTSFKKYRSAIHDIITKNWKTGLKMDFYVA